MFTAGACPLDHDGAVVSPGNVAAQAQRVKANIELAGTAVPLTLRHLPFTLLWECAAMAPGGRVLGPASTSFNDYVGTVAADDAEAVMDRPSLYELAQIDRDRYTILGIGLNVDGPTTAAVYAFDRLEHSIARLEEIVELGLSRGEIPVVRFDIPEMDAGDFIRHAFRRMSVRLVIQDLRDQALMVSEPSSAQANEARGSKPL